MADGFMLRNEDVRRMEAELGALDPLLRELAGSSARIDRHWLGSPGRQVELRRADGVTVGLAVCAMVRNGNGHLPLRYLVAPFAWAEIGGERMHWRTVPQWTVLLSSAEQLEAAKPVIEGAWRCAAAANRDLILETSPALPPLLEDDE